MLLKLHLVSPTDLLQGLNVQINFFTLTEIGFLLVRPAHRPKCVACSPLYVNRV